MSTFSQKLQQALVDRQSLDLYRYRRTLNSPQSTEIDLEGKRLINFCSNDYLGLASHPDVIKACKQGLDSYGVGSGASHLVVGHSHAHHALEEELADFTGRARALLFSSGYLANVGTLTALLGKQDHVFEDKLNHASLLDGGLFSGARFRRFPHLDERKLAKLLSEQKAEGSSFIVSDGVFSMDGDCAKLPQLIELASSYKAQLMIDDAHGFGVLGTKGGGIVQHYQEAGFTINEDTLSVLIGTLGKAFGTQGAFVCGSETLIETLIQTCRPYIYTTALAPAMAEATRCSLKLLQSETWRREKLQAMIKQFREFCERFEYPLTESGTAIQGLMIGDASRTLQVSKLLEAEGIFVSAIRPPTVPRGTARLRITFSAAHSQEQLEALLKALDKIRPLVSLESAHAEP